MTSLSRAAGSGCVGIVDDVTRECPRAVPDIARRGKPDMIVSDNGTELTSNAVLAWCGQARVEWHYTNQRGL